MADAESMDKTEVLILEVSKNPVSFNKAEKAYKKTVKNKDIWNSRHALTHVSFSFYAGFFCFFFVETEL